MLTAAGVAIVSMSALGQKQTSRHLQPMSALPPIADIAERDRNVCFVPKADICSAANSRLFDDLIGNSEHLGRDVEA
jgi:hypothetical protein